MDSCFVFQVSGWKRSCDQMKNVETTLDSKIALESQLKDSDKTGSFAWLFDVAGITLTSAAFYVGLDAWKDWFSTPDRSLFSVFILVGVLITLIRSHWHGGLSKSRIWSMRITCVLASMLICGGVALSNPMWSGIACSLSIAAWCMGRIRGETIMHALFIGSMLVVPFAFEAMESRGDFEQLQSFAVDMTSLLADAVSEPNARENNTILFKNGIADHFASIGTWESVIGLLGVSLFVVLAFRRSLLSSACLLSSTAVVWVAIRSVAWVTISYLANRYGTWYPWSFGLELGLFLAGVVLVLSLDQFFASIFKPIPFELFNAESPLGAFLWNWLCCLPNLILRIPKQNKISLRWRQRLHLAGKKPSFRTDMKWLRIEFFDLLLHPIGAIGSLIDAVRGWRYSRSWKSFFCNLPTLVLLIALFVTMAFSASKRNDKQTQFVLNESLKLCSTESLEAACSQRQELDFCKSIGSTPILNETNTKVPESIRSQVEFQCKRVLTANPNNQVAKYRLGMIYALNNNSKEAFREMKEASKIGDFPQADAWLAKTLISSRATGPAAHLQELLVHLENAYRWPKIDFRLPFYYSRLLEERGERTKAIFIARQAVAANPDWILELAKLYSRVGDEEALKKTANEAEAYFYARMNRDNEKESDRLAVSDARLLTERPKEAAAVLEEGLIRNPDAKTLRRQLSKIQVMMYRVANVDFEKAEVKVDFSLLEKAAKTDPQNPDVSVEIAKLIPFGKRPTPDLMEVLKDQVQRGITSVPTLLLLGEGFYERKNLPAAQKYWELALDKEPENFAVLNNLATCLIAISESNAERALELISRANSLCPANADILDTWGEILIAAKKPQDAINKLEMVIKIDPKRMENRKKLVTAYHAVGMTKYEEAQLKVIEDMEQAMANEKFEKEKLEKEKSEKEKRE